MQSRRGDILGGAFHTAEWRESHINHFLNDATHAYEGIEGT